MARSLCFLTRSSNTSSLAATVLAIRILIVYREPITKGYNRLPNLSPKIINIKYVAKLIHISAVGGLVGRRDMSRFWNIEIKFSRLFSGERFPFYFDFNVIQIFIRIL